MPPGTAPGRLIWHNPRLAANVGGRHYRQRMSERATIGAANESWDEKTYAELPDGGKLTRATVVQ